MKGRAEAVRLIDCGEFSSYFSLVLRARSRKLPFSLHVSCVASSLATTIAKQMQCLKREALLSARFTRPSVCLLGGRSNVILKVLAVPDAYLKRQSLLQMDRWRANGKNTACPEVHGRLSGSFL